MHTVSTFLLTYLERTFDARLAPDHRRRRRTDRRLASRRRRGCSHRAHRAATGDERSGCPLPRRVPRGGDRLGDESAQRLRGTQSGIRAHPRAVGRRDRTLGWARCGHAPVGPAISRYTHSRFTRSQVAPSRRTHVVPARRRGPTSRSAPSPWAGSVLTPSPPSCAAPWRASSWLQASRRRPSRPRRAQRRRPRRPSRRA